MQEEKLQMFRNRLQKVYRHLHKQAKKAGISCYRVYDNDLPEFPFCIEFYGNNLYVAEFKRNHSMPEEEHERWLEQSLSVIATQLGVEEKNIFIKLRQKKQGRPGQYRKFGNEKHEFEVEENGLKFIVNLSDYLDTGLFTDHRKTRELVRSVSKDKKVLNLFCYTGSFSVYAAAGGASRVVSVDLSNTYLSWAERNMRLNGFTDENKYFYVQADVKQYLQTIQDDLFDQIILDPPTFSNSKRMKDILDIQRDHAALINDCLRILNPGGTIYFSTNYKKFVLDEKSITSSSIKDITRQTTPFDFERKLERVCYRISK